MSEQDDIDQLKIQHIGQQPNGRMHLGVAGQPAPAKNDLDEAWGGSGEAPVAKVDPEELRGRIVGAMKSVFDPEIPLNIYDLGLIYGFEIDEASNVEVEMTLTAPGCPVAGMLVSDVARKVGDVEGVARSHVKLVWDPPWTKDRMSEEALLELGLL